MKEKINWQNCMKYRCEQCRHYQQCKKEEENYINKTALQKNKVKKQYGGMYVKGINYYYTVTDCINLFNFNRCNYSWNIRLNV